MKTKIILGLTDFIKNSKLEHNYVGFYSVPEGHDQRV